jgi:dehydrogenase/reductase SDR family member 1
MGTLTNKVAVVTGASRGVGKGIAMGLGEQGATVYVSGRTLVDGQATVPLTGTLTDTVNEVNKIGGKGIGAKLDHNDDSQVKSLFERVQSEQGKLDILVNNAWAGYEGYSTGTHFPPNHPFWQKPLSYWDENLVGVRWAYVSSAFAIPQMIAQGGGLIVNISVPVPDAGNPSYAVAKIGTDRLTWEMATMLREHNIAVVSLYPGLVRTESVMLNAQYFDMSTSESILFTGRAVAALASDPKIMDKSGKPFVVAQLAKEYGFEDVKEL